MTRQPWMGMALSALTHFPIGKTSKKPNQNKQPPNPKQTKKKPTTTTNPKPQNLKRSDVSVII